MCTVTFIPNKNGYHLTSNRDEKCTRKKAFHPAVQPAEGVKLIFPVDGDTGGTWIALKENGDSICLLNGAFENFTDTGLYTSSRGKIVLQIAMDTDMANTFTLINLLHTAPFTLIILQNKKLFECRWDGFKKYCTALNAAIPCIWSSSTLYNPGQQQLRGKWFADWLKHNPFPKTEDVFCFHKNGGDGNSEHDLMMNRNNKYFTVSITCITVTADTYLMQYADTINNDNTATAFAAKK